jgi:hypothetical protein
VLDDEQFAEFSAKNQPAPQKPSEDGASSTILEPENSEEEAIPPIVAKPRGRPSMKDTIREAYYSLEKDYSKPFASHIEAIRAKAKQIAKTDSDNGLREDAIRKAVGKIFELEKSASKLGGKL